MTIPTQRFDAAEHIRTPEDEAMMLEVALEDDGDFADLARAFDTIARARGMASLAQQLGLSRDELSSVLNPWQPPAPSIATLLPLLEKLGVPVDRLAEAAA